MLFNLIGTLFIIFPFKQFIVCSISPPLFHMFAKNEKFFFLLTMLALYAYDGTQCMRREVGGCAGHM